MIIDIIIMYTDVVLALKNTLYNLQEATNETGQICVMLVEPAGGLADPLLVIFTIIPSLAS